MAAERKIPNNPPRIGCVVRRWATVAGRVLAIPCLIGAALCYLSYRADLTVLRAVTAPVVTGVNEPAEQVLALLEWVRSIPGTGRNPGYFLWNRWRATPLQTLQHGGDCADRSRLLSTVLRIHGIRSTLAMCFDCATGEPAHTVIEARPFGGSPMLLDPMFGLVFPREDGRGYHGISDVRADPGIVERRLDAVCGPGGPGCDGDRYYLRSQAAYESVSTFHWDKTLVTRLLAWMLRGILDCDLFRLSRPAWLEEPKLMGLAVFAACGVGMSLVGCFLGGSRGDRSSPTKTEPQGSLDRLCKTRDSLSIPASAAHGETPVIGRRGSVPDTHSIPITMAR